jgi:hypothetical protein
LNGFGTLLAFKGHFLRTVSEDELVNSFEIFIRSLADNSPVFQQLSINVANKNEFKLAQGEIGTILGVMNQMKEICQRPIPFLSTPSHQNPTLSSPSSLSPTSSNINRRSEVTASNVESEVHKVLRRRLGSLMTEEDENPTIVRSKTDSFPFSLEIKCIRCEKLIRVSISQDKRPGRKYNIQTLKYTNHAKSHT